MSERRRRRRRGGGGATVTRVTSDAVVTQGAGTWLEIPRKLSMEHHLGPVMALQKWREDARLGSQDPAVMLAVMEEMRADFARVLWRAVARWNWVTDMEGELGGDRPPRGVAEGEVGLALQFPIWEGSEWCGVDDMGQIVPPELPEGMPVYVGMYPDDYMELALVGWDEDGRALVCRGELTRELSPGPEGDYAILGYPQPNDPAALEWCSLEELTFIGNALTEHFNQGMAKRGTPRPKARR